MVLTMGGRSTEYKQFDVYTLADDGKTILVNSTSINTKGERKTLMVYDKS